jgi:hypothetical protein
VPKTFIPGDITVQLTAMRAKAQSLSGMSSPEARLIAQLLIETADMMEVVMDARTPRPAIVH